MRIGEGVVGRCRGVASTPVSSKNISFDTFSVSLLFGNTFEDAVERVGGGLDDGPGRVLLVAGDGGGERGGRRRGEAVAW